MDGPLMDDWYFSVSISPPMYERGGLVAVLRWNEPGPFPDQRRVYELRPSLVVEQISGVVAELFEGYLISRASAVRRTIARLERSGWLRL